MSAVEKHRIYNRKRHHDHRQLFLGNLYRRKIRDVDKCECGNYFKAKTLTKTLVPKVIVKTNCGKCKK